ncbi:MAG: mevalonate kinase [Anaerolineales bacterium]|jgi:mevalonate kinase
MTRASASGKFILFGEHAVVYGQPAIAFPLRQLRANAQIRQLPDQAHDRVHLIAPDVNFDMWLHEADRDDPLRKITQLTLEELHVRSFPAIEIRISAEIPVASGLGSGAAVSTAVLRALCRHFNHPLELSRQSELVYEVEKIHHGTPSGIDNTVIVYDQAVYFVRGRQPERISIGGEFSFILADTGLPSNTGEIVAKVRQTWERDRASFDEIFQEIGQITRNARTAIAGGDVSALGNLMDQNQEKLEALGVSSKTIEKLLSAARDCGACGAKLSGAGVGGIIVVLIQPAAAYAVTEALRAAGAVWIRMTRV